MKWLVTRVMFLIFVFAFAISGALYIGTLQPKNNLLALLKLDECASPCWIGIVPGKTTWNEAKQQIKHMYSSDQYNIQLINDGDIRIEMVGTLNFLQIGLSEDKKSLVYGIRLTPYVGGSYKSVLSIGDVVELIGSPNDLVLSVDADSYAPIIRFREKRVQLKTSQTECNKILITQKLTWIAFSPDDPGWGGQTQSSIWQGFNKCYKFQEQNKN